MKLLIFPAVSDDWFQAIRAISLDLNVVNAVNEDEAFVAIADADCFYGTINRRLLGAAANLRWIQTSIIGLEHYMFPELIAHPVVMTNVRGIYSDIIGDHVMGFILNFARGFHHYRWLQRERNWKTEYSWIYLPASTLGIIGLGGIGQEVAKRGKACGMYVIAIDPRITERPGVVDDLRTPDELNWLLSESDFVVICAPQTPQTTKMIGREQLWKMKRTAYFINVGRGKIVDLQALTEALQADEIAGAGLDVFEVEPLPADHPLWAMENVIITPHIAYAAPDVTEQRRLSILLDNLRRFVNGELLRNVVEKEKWF